MGLQNLKSSSAGLILIAHFAFMTAPQSTLAQASPSISGGQIEALAPQEGFAQLQEALSILSLQREIQQHLENGRWQEAITAIERTLEFGARLMGPDNPLAEVSLSTLSDLYIAVGDYPKAVERARQRLKILERRRASDSEIAAALLDLGQAERLADDESATKHLERALAIRERLLGPNHLATAEVYEALGIVYLAQADRSQARELLERARTIKELQLTSEDSELATIYVNLAMLYRPEGRLHEARELLEKAVGLQERTETLGPTGLATSLGHLGLVYMELSQWNEAKASLRRAIELNTSFLGPDHPQLITDLANLGHVHYDLGEHEEAEQLLQRASAIAHQKLGPRHRLTLDADHALGSVLMAAGKWTESRALLSKTLSIREELLGEDHVDTAMSRAVFGQLLAALGSTEQGLALMGEAIQDFAAAERLQDPVVAEIITQLVDTVLQGQFLGNEPLEAESWGELTNILTRIRETFESAYGENHLRLAGVFEVLAKAALARGNLQQAREFHDQVRAIHEALGLEGHPAQAVYFGNEASILRASGNFRGALDAMEQAFEIFAEKYGRDNIWPAQIRVDLASFLEINGEVDRARDLLTEALSIEEQNLTRVLTAGSEADQRRFLRTLYDSTILTTSFHYRSAPDDPRAMRLALETVLRRKGRDLDAALLRTRLARESKSAEIEKQRHKLRRLRSLWTRNLVGGELDEEVSWTEIEDLERRLADAAGVTPLPTVTIADVQRALPPETVLVEIFAVEPPDVIHYRNEPKRYLAYLLGAEGDPRFVDLGVAEPIDQAIGEFLNAIISRSLFRREARALDALTFAKLRPFFGGARNVVISPDGELLRVPFAALVNPDGHYRMETHAISYVTSGRDLVALHRSHESPREKAWIFADPDLDKNTTEYHESLAQLSQMPLPSTRDEAREVGALLGLPSERILLGPFATEQAVKEVHGPVVLHLATHGYLLPELESEEADRLQRGLVRSGLALTAGAAEDGVLSALELAEVDLAGTEVGVLSACDTGRGELMDGYGLFGLRRALALAGARTQVTSLWKVDDEPTADLMTSWYSQILRGVPRGEAWRQTQLAALDDRGHPFYWAAFIVSGDTGPMPEMKKRH